MVEINDEMKLLEQLRPFILSDAVYGRMHANLHDLAEASEWFLAAMDRVRGKTLSVEQLEDFLIGLEVQYVDHATFHLRSLKRDIKTILAAIPDTSGA